MRLLLSILAISSVARAGPSIGLPINAQVPPVARVNQPFEFVFSDSTFISSAPVINYALSDGPAWLNLNGPGRTFSGTPEPQDAGSLRVSLIATDQSGPTSMSVTFVISTDLGPGLGTPIADQLSAYGAVSTPDSLLLAPASAFSMSFSFSTFTNINTTTVYYATCADNNPLPSWIQFDPVTLSFSGTTPSASPSPHISQTYALSLTASDIFGFGGAYVAFQIVIESHLFEFSSSTIPINSTAGSPINSSVLWTSLTLDGQPVSSADITQASANTPSWLTFDAHNLILSGTPPKDAVQENFTVSLNDVYGDNASTTILLQLTNISPVSLLVPVGVLNATIGGDFEYNLNNTATVPGSVINIDLGEASSWLVFDQRNKVIGGYVPDNLKPQSIFLNVTASQGSQVQSLILTIDVESPNQTNSRGTGGTVGSSGSSTGSAVPGQNYANAPASRAGVRNTRNWIAAAVIIPLALLSGLAFFICCFRRRRKKQDWETVSQVSSKAAISRPVLTENTKNPRPPLQMSGALGAIHKRASSRLSMAPKLDVPGLWASGMTKRNPRFRSSKVSVDRMSQTRKMESWSKEVLDGILKRPRSSAIVQQGLIPVEETITRAGLIEGPKPAPIDGSGRLVNTNTTLMKGYSRRQSGRSNMNFGRSGVRSSQRASGIGHGTSTMAYSASMIFGSRGVGHGNGAQPRGQFGVGVVKESWRHCREPTFESEDSWVPTEESFSDDSQIKVMKPLVLRTAQEDDRVRIRTHHTESSRNRVTIRPVQPSNALQQYHSLRAHARQRQSTSPLFSAGPVSSRLSSHYSVIPSSRTKRPFSNSDSTSSHPSTPPKQSQHRSYSQSSSLNPPTRPSPSQARTSNIRTRPRTNLPFTAFIDSPSLPCSRDSRYNSVASEGQLQGDMWEDVDADGNREWQFGYRDPARRSTVSGLSEDASVADLPKRPIPGSLLDRLTNIKVRAEAGAGGQNENGGLGGGGLKIGKTRASRLDRTTGLGNNDVGNLSMRGEVVEESTSGAFL